MARRKYVTIHEIVEQANRYLHESPQGEQAGRQMLCSFVESFLHKTNNYRGFGYLNAEQSKDGNEPGIIFDHSPAHKHVYPDETRRAYIMPRE